MRIGQDCESAIQQSFNNTLHQTLTNAMELAIRVQTFKGKLLGNPPGDHLDGPKNVVPVRPVLEELRDHAYRLNSQIQEAHEALSLLESELN